MLNKLKSLMTLPAMGNTVLGSRLFTKYKIDNQVSGETYDQLISLIKDAYILSGGKEIYDVDPTEPSRVEMGVGMYALTIKDIPVVVTTDVRIVKERQIESAIIHVPILFQQRFEMEIDNLFPSSKSPEHHQLTNHTNDWIYDRRVRSVTLIGKIDPMLGLTAPLVDPEIYEQTNKVFDQFVNHKQSYLDSQRPYREVMMLYGPPGTGKTSLVRHFINKYKTHLVEFNPRVKYSHLVKLLNSLEGQPVVVLVEELDSYKFLCRQPDVEITDPEGKVTKRRLNGVAEDEYHSQNYTNFITLLDGLVPLKNCIFIFTTNHPEQLLQKIYRMGRVNHHIEVNYPREETVRNFLDLTEVDGRWVYLKSLEDNRLPLDAIYQIRNANTVDAIKDIIATRDRTLNLKDQQSYE